MDTQSHTDTQGPNYNKHSNTWKFSKAEFAALVAFTARGREPCGLCLDPKARAVYATDGESLVMTRPTTPINTLAEQATLSHAHAKSLLRAIPPNGAITLHPTGTTILCTPITKHELPASSPIVVDRETIRHPPAFDVVDKLLKLQPGCSAIALDPRKLAAITKLGDALAPQILEMRVYGPRDPILFIGRGDAGTCTWYAAIMPCRQ